MSPAPRKRSSAFDDFPGSDSQPAGGEAFLPGRVEPTSAPQVERIERLKPSQMLPDRFQPRRLLPASLRQDFFSGRLDCYQAATRWLELAHQDAGIRVEVERLHAMGDSFGEHGQIKPITGSWVPASDGKFIFLIETGERRFWAACLQSVVDKSETEPLLRVEVVEKPTRQRQVLENRHAEPPSAVGQACEVAALILSEMGLQPDPAQGDEFEYFRQARAQRMPAGLWERITPLMQLTRPRMVQLLNILMLPTPLLDLADRYRLPERVLREVLALPHEQWERMIKLSIQNSLTADDVAELAQPLVPTRPTPAGRGGLSNFIPPERVALSGLRRFANALSELDEVSQSQALDEIANDLVINHQAEGIINILGELAERVSIRLAGRRL